MTAEAMRFVTPVTFKTLAPLRGGDRFYDETDGWKPSHIELADAADLLLIAPATANTLAKLAHGLADDALSCIALALTQAQIAHCPGHERQDVAASGHAAKRRDVAKSAARNSSGRTKACFPVDTKGWAGCGRWN